MHPEQRRIFRSLTPEKKLKIALRLYYSTRDMKAAGLRMQNPDWTEEKIQTKVREIFSMREPNLFQIFTSRMKPGRKIGKAFERYRRYDRDLS